MKNDQLYIYLHIPKCAGSTIRKHIVKNFSPSEALFLNFENVRLSRYVDHKKEVYQRAAGRYIKKFSKKERSNVRLIYGETVPYSVDKYFERPAKYITFIRDPLKRTVSLYNFFRTMYEREGPIGKKKDHFYLQLLIDGKVPEFEVWLKEKYGDPDLAVGSMYRFLKRFGYLDGNFEDKSLKDQAANIFNKFYYVGLTENSKDIYYLYDLLGIEKFFINQNISKKHIKNKESSTSLLKKKNRDDLVLYKEAKKRNKKFKQKHPDFNKRAKRIIMKSKKLVIYNQLRYDTFETFRRLSVYLKKRSGLYKKVFYMIRKKE